MTPFNLNRRAELCRRILNGESQAREQLATLYHQQRWREAAKAVRNDSEGLIQHCLSVVASKR